VENALPAILRKLMPDAARRGALSDTGRRLVDGGGAPRVAAEIFKLACAR